MDTTGKTASDTVPDPKAAGKESQRKVSPTLLLLLLGAILFALLTRTIDRDRASGHDGGLIAWTEAADAPGIARTSGKPILYDFTAEWCGPCKMLDREGWADPEVAALVNGSYVPARVVDRSREEGRNSPLVDELERRYRVGAFPTLVIAGADGKEIAIAQGFSGKDRLMEFLESSRGKPLP